MKKIIMVLAIAATAGLAQAGSYSDAQRTVELCKMIGGDAARAFEAREAGKPFPALPDELKGNYATPLSEWAYNYGYRDAISRVGAFQGGTAKCLDNLDYLTREWKYNQRILDVSQLH